MVDDIFKRVDKDKSGYLDYHGHWNFEKNF